MTEEYTKHLVNTDALETLGSIISPEEKRDAIHLAVFPVCAGETLRPGQHVTIDEDDGLAYKARVNAGLGIVDPFLDDLVNVDERFWLVVYPRQISSLRHVWEHPSFPHSGETELPLLIGPDKAGSERWLREFAGQQDIDFHRLMADCETAVGDHGWSDEYVTIHGEDASGNIPGLFWDHYEIYTGTKVTKRPQWFSCSC